MNQNYIVGYIMWSNLIANGKYSYHVRSQKVNLKVKMCYFSLLKIYINTVTNTHKYTEENTNTNTDLSLSEKELL